MRGFSHFVGIRQKFSIYFWILVGDTLSWHAARWAKTKRRKTKEEEQVNRKSKNPQQFDRHSLRVLDAIFHATSRGRETSPSGCCGAVPRYFRSIISCFFGFFGGVGGFSVRSVFFHFDSKKFKNHYVNNFQHFLHFFYSAKFWENFTKIGENFNEKCWKMQNFSQKYEE